MEHHDLAHKGLRIWPLDQTSLRHHNPCCTIHHKHAPGAHSAHRAHKNCSQSFKLLKLFFILHWCHDPLLCAGDLIWLSFYKQNVHLQQVVFYDDGDSTVLLCNNTSSPLGCGSSEPNVSLQLTIVPTYTSGCVFSHLCLCDLQQQDTVGQKCAWMCVTVGTFVSLLKRICTAGLRGKGYARVWKI